MLGILRRPFSISTVLSSPSVQAAHYTVRLGTDGLSVRVRCRGSVAMPATPEPIVEHKQLLVEGRADQEFFNALLRHLGIGDIEVKSYGGKESFRRFLNVFVRAPSFDEIQSLGIVRDADDSATSAFQSIQDSLISVNLPAPDRALTPASGSPRVDVFIMPNNADTGALEDLCLRALEGDPAMQCVSEFMQCIQERSAVAPKELGQGQDVRLSGFERGPRVAAWSSGSQGVSSLGGFGFRSADTVCTRGLGWRSICCRNWRRLNVLRPTA